jgi:hypothetical protein
MDHQELNDDATPDDEIVRLLAIDPSPEFVATIRQRVALDSAPRVGAAASVVGIMVAGAVAVVALTLVRVEVPAKRASVVPLLASRPIEMAAFTPVIETGNAPAVVNRSSGAGTVGLKNETPVSSAEILVDPREARAIRAFIDRAVGGRIDRSAMSETLTSPRLESAPVQDLFIAPIQLLPLAGDEGRKP